MVDINEKFRSERGISSRKLTRNLIAALGMLGACNFNIDNKKWENALQAAISVAKNKGMKFNFSKLELNQFYNDGRNLKILYLLEEDVLEYRTKFKNSEYAREYIQEFTENEKEIAIYEEMAREFLKKFGYRRKRNRWNGTII